MTSAVANVKLGIQIVAADSASDAIRKAQTSLKGLGKTADETADAAGKVSNGLDAGKMQQTTQRMGGAFSAIASAMGPAAAQIADIGKSATALGSTANIIPGPIGLAAAAVIGLAAGAKLLADHFAQAAAAERLLGSSESRRLKDVLDLDADAARAVAIAIDDLKNNAVRPADELLKQVADNAKALGGEPVEAVKALAEAWRGGASAIIAYQREHGKIADLDRDTIEYAATRLGLDREAVGLAEKQADLKTRIQTQFTDAIEAQRQLRKAEEDYIDLRHKGIHGAGQDTRDEANLAANALQDKLKGLAAQHAAADATVRATQAALNAQLQIEAVEKQRATQSQEADARADLARTKQLTVGLKLQNILEQQESIDRELLLVETLRAAVGDKETDAQKKTLTLLHLQNEVKFKGLVDADQAEKKAKAAAAAQASASARQAVNDAKFAAMKAQFDRDGLQVERERMAVLDAEHAKDLAAASTQRNPKVAAAQRLAADEKYKTDKAALERTIAAETEQTNAELQKTLDEQNRQSADFAQNAADTVLQANQVRAKSIADTLRAQGKHEEADLAESRQAHVDREAELARIDKERIASLALVNAASTDAANIQAAAAAKVVIAETALADKERQLATAKRQRAQESIDIAASALDAVGQRLQAIGANGNFAAQAVGQSVSSMSRGLSALGKIADDDAQKLGKTVAAVGEAAAGVANAIINASSQRLLQQLDVEEQGALKTAKTEEEKAAIVEKFEKKKADARDAATRQSAGIMALMAAAQAIAYAFTPGMQAASIGQGVAAVAFGAIALGATGSSYVPGAATAGGGGGGFSSGAAGGSAGGSGSGSGGGVTNVFNFNGVYATQQQLGKALNTATGSLAGTGITRRKGA